VDTTRTSSLRASAIIPRAFQIPWGKRNGSRSLDLSFFCAATGPPGSSQPPSINSQRGDNNPGRAPADREPFTQTGSLAFFFKVLKKFPPAPQRCLDATPA